MKEIKMNLFGRKNLFFSILVLSFLAGCLQKTKTYVFKPVLNTQVSTDDFLIFMQEVDILDRERAEVFLKNRFEFIKSHFVDSYDPYFGLNTLAPWCKEQLALEYKIINDQEGLWAYVLLPTDPHRNAVCSEQSQLTLLVIRFCQSENKAYTFWIKSATNGDIPSKLKSFNCESEMSFYE